MSMRVQDNGRNDRRAWRIEALAWAGVLIAASVVLVGLDYRTTDPDSALHVDIVRDLAACSCCRGRSSRSASRPRRRRSS
jgi:hypothetical protein